MENTTEVAPKQPDNQTPEIDMAKLEADTNALYGEDFLPDQPIEAPPQGQSPEVPKPESVPLATEATAPASGQALPDSLKDVFNDTPFKGDDLVKGVQDAVKSWKELTREFGSQREKVKPYEQLISLANENPEFKRAIQFAHEFFTKPEMRSAYQSQFGLQRPDPSQYDLFDPAQRQAYDQAQTDYEARLIDSRINARFADIEKERFESSAKSEFKQLVPDGNADELAKWVNEDFANLSVGERMKQLWQLKNLPKLREQIYAEARKDLAGKIETASHATPAAPAPPTNTVSDEEIANYVTKNGPKSAYGKYTKKTVDAAITRLTNAVYAEA